MRDLARWQIGLAMWRWTADGVNVDTGAVRLDAIKYSVMFHPATVAAIDEATSGGGNLRHEHVVQRIWLADRIIEMDMDVDEIQAFLSRWGRAAIVTRDEHNLLGHANRAPQDWNWDGGDPYQRYVNAGIELQQPPPHG